MGEEGREEMQLLLSQGYPWYFFLKLVLLSPKQSSIFIHLVWKVLLIFFFFLTLLPLWHRTCFSASHEHFHFHLVLIGTLSWEISSFPAGTFRQKEEAGILKWYKWFQKNLDGFKTTLKWFHSFSIDHHIIWNSFQAVLMNSHGFCRRLQRFPKVLEGTLGILKGFLGILHGISEIPNILQEK